VIGWPPASASDSLAISVIMASVGVSERFTMKIAATPANPDASPASGWRPTLANAAAASGIRMRYPASEATDETTPTRMRMKVRAHVGAAPTSLRMSDPSRPDSSATPAPIIAMKVTATTPNPAKLLTKEEKMNRMPSTDNRLRIAIVSSTIVQSSSYGPDGEDRPGWVVSS